MTIFYLLHKIFKFRSIFQNSCLFCIFYQAQFVLFIFVFVLVCYLYINMSLGELKRAIFQEENTIDQKLTHKFEDSSRLKRDRLPSKSPINGIEFHRQLEKSVLRGHQLRIVFKGFKLNKNAEDLVKFCLSLLQYQAAFPIKFFFLQQAHKFFFLTFDDDLKKQILVQTKLSVSSITSTESQAQQNTRNQANILRFFCNYLIPSLQSFIRNTMNWQLMVYSEQIDQQSIIEKFKQSILLNVNQIYSQHLEQTNR